MQDSHKVFVYAVVCTAVLLGGCHTHNGSERQRTNVPDVDVKISDLQITITSTMIEMQCEVANNTGENIWICETMRNVHDPNSAHAATAGVFVDEDDRTLIVDGRIGIYYGHDIWCNMGGSYTRLMPGQKSPVVLRTFLEIPDYRALGSGFLRILKKGIDHLACISFEIGYFTEADLASVQAGPDTIHAIRRDESGDRIDVFDSSQGELCRAERVARVVVDGVYLPYEEWLTGEGERGHLLQ